MSSEGKNPERVFMHDIATPIAVALGMIDLLVDDVQSGNSTLEPGQLKRVEKAQAALLKLQTMMSERRKAILEAEGLNTKPAS